MHEGFGRGGHNGEVCFPLQNLSRFSQTVGGEVLLDELEELLLGEADVGLGDDGGAVQRLEGEDVPLGGAAQAARAAVVVGLRDHRHEVVGVLLELDVLDALVEQDGLADELLQLPVGEDGQLGHDLLRLPRPERGTITIIKDILCLFDSLIT